MKKVQSAFLKGLGSVINIKGANRLRPVHHNYGPDAIEADFRRIGDDIKNSMSKTFNEAGLEENLLVKTNPMAESSEKIRSRINRF